MFWALWLPLLIALANAVLIQNYYLKMIPCMDQLFTLQK